MVVLVLIVLVCSFLAGCTGTGGSDGSTPASTQAVTPISTLPGIGQTVTIGLIAKNMSFNTSAISVPAGATVIVNFQNQEPRGSAQVSGIPHNFAVYENVNATLAIFSGEIITGGQNITYTFTAPARSGTYVFRCDVHPTTMTGQFIVT